MKNLAKVRSHAADPPARAGTVLIIVQNLPVPFDRRVWLEATTLASAGYSVTVICPKMKGFNASRETLENVEIRRYPLPISAQGFVGFVGGIHMVFVATSLVTARIALFGRGFDVVQVAILPRTFSGRSGCCAARSAECSYSITTIYRQRCSR